MPRFPKPYHRAQRGLWYVQIGRKQINLGLDRDDAFKQYHELLRRSEIGRFVRLGPSPALSELWSTSAGNGLALVG